MLISVHQGLIWLLIATVAEVPPVVRLAILLDRSPLLLAHSYSTSQVFVFLNLNGRILFSRIHQQRVVDRTLSDKTIRAPRHCTPLFATIGKGQVI